MKGTRYASRTTVIHISRSRVRVANATFRDLMRFQIGLSSRTLGAASFKSRIAIPAAIRNIPHNRLLIDESLMDQTPFSGLKEVMNFDVWKKTAAVCHDLASFTIANRPIGRHGGIGGGSQLRHRAGPCGRHTAACRRGGGPDLVKAPDAQA